MLSTRTFERLTNLDTNVQRKGYGQKQVFISLLSIPQIEASKLGNNMANSRSATTNARRLGDTNILKQ